MSALMAKEFGDRPQNDMLRLNIELMQPVIMDLLTAQDEDEGVKLSSNDVKNIATAIQKGGQALAQEEKRVAEAEERGAEKARKQAAEAADKVMSEKGLTKKTALAIRASILGQKAPKQ